MNLLTYLHIQSLSQDSDPPDQSAGWSWKPIAVLRGNFPSTWPKSPSVTKVTAARSQRRHLTMGMGCTARARVHERRHDTSGDTRAVIPRATRCAGTRVVRRRLREDGSGWRPRGPPRRRHLVRDTFRPVVKYMKSSKIKKKEIIKIFRFLKKKKKKLG